MKCRFCGEFLDGFCNLKPRTRWYYSTSAVIISLLFLGPLALPVVWINPKYKVITKVVVTIVVIALTIWLCQLMGDMYQQLMKQIHDLGLH